jgi:hypothetical protein
MLSLGELLGKEGYRRRSYGYRVFQFDFTELRKEMQQQSPEDGQKARKS